MTHRIHLRVLTALLAAAGPVDAAVRPVRLRCEHLPQPVIDTAPQFSWALTSDQRDARQTAYQIRVATTPERLRDNPDLWDSGKIASNNTLGIPYTGKPLRSNTTVYWTVRAWNAHDELADAAEPARFDVALLDPSEWKAQWIADPRPPVTDEAELYRDRPAPMFRHEFTVKGRIHRARVLVSGLGYYDLRVNGRRINADRLEPNWTSFGKRVPYVMYDLTDVIAPGPNALGVIVGNGWYNPLPLRMWGWLNLREHMAIGQPRVILQLHLDYEDGTQETIVTDERWRVGESPILHNSIYLGEVYDARREIDGWDRPGFDDRDWPTAVIAREPVGTLRAATAPSVRQVETIRPVKITEPRPGVFIFDMGRNLAGTVTLRVRGRAGQPITLRYGELLYPDGRLNVMTSVCGQIKARGVGGPGAPDVAWQTDRYICRGDGEETFTPRFTFHGFRYVEITGLTTPPTLDTLTAHTLHTPVESAGTFACSDELFNGIHEMCRRTLLSNLVSVQSDCPARERFGYGGDIVATSEYVMLNFDVHAFYRKTTRDFGDDARTSGGITETAPFVGIDAHGDGFGNGVGPIGWGSVHPVLLWQLYQYYGDRRLIEEQYPIAQRWMAFLDSRAKDLLIDRGLGDHESLAPKVVPLTSTGFYAWNAQLMARLAGVLGRTEDQQRYSERARQITEAFNRAFLDASSGRYALGTQACQAFALYLDLVPPELREKAVEVLTADIARHKNHLTTGIFGTKFMLMGLSDAGRPDLAAAIVAQRDFPGWGHMLERGATTLWEHWEFSDNTYSHNHPMFGSVSEWFMKVPGGIRPADDAVGFDRIEIRPAILPSLEWASARYESARGPIGTAWRRTADTLELEVEVPANTTARVYVPAATAEQVTESGRALAAAPGVRTVHTMNGVVQVEVGSGRYRFTAPKPTKP